MTISIKITRPFSANAMYTPGFYKTRQYKAWIREAGKEIMIQRPDKHTGPYRLVLEAGRPDARVRDADNLLKPVSDLLVRHQIVRDDSDAVETVARWVDGMTGMVATIEGV